MNFEELSAKLAELSPRLYPLFSQEFGDAVIGVDLDELHSSAEELKAIGFDRLSMITAVDYVDWLVLVYRLKSRSLSAALFLKTQLPKGVNEAASVYDVWPAADWQEREVYDLFGIRFEGHPDLRRILLPEDFVGHPLRKDYDDPRLIRRPDYI